jgi:outer membrane biosynthesis protein TonB
MGVLEQKYQFKADIEYPDDRAKGDLIIEPKNPAPPEDETQKPEVAERPPNNEQQQEKPVQTPKPEKEPENAPSVAEDPLDFLREDYLNDKAVE